VVYAIKAEPHSLNMHKISVSGVFYAEVWYSMTGGAMLAGL